MRPVVFWLVGPWVNRLDLTQVTLISSWERSENLRPDKQIDFLTFEGSLAT